VAIPCIFQCGQSVELDLLRERYRYSLLLYLLTSNNDVLRYKLQLHCSHTRCLCLMLVACCLLLVACWSLVFVGVGRWSLLVASCEPFYDLLLATSLYRSLLLFLL
jgi:fatty acid desaturase